MEIFLLFFSINFKAMTGFEEEKEDFHLKKLEGF